MEENYIHKELTERIIRCFYNVHDALGPGFLESVYENSVVVELEEARLQFEVQKPLKVGLLVNFGDKLEFKRRVF